jgi:hypothetical protein
MTEQFGMKGVLMYLFTRSRKMRAADPAGAIGWAVEVAELASGITGRTIEAWGSVMSPDAGLVVWSTWVEHLSEIEQAGDKLMAAPEYLDSVRAGEQFGEGPVADGLASVVHGEIDPAAPTANYVTVASAVAAPGHLSDAIASGIEIADHATRVSGMSTLFVVNSTGPYGGVAWLTGSPDIETVEAGESALMADPEWLQLIDRVGPSYNADAAQSIFRRIV